MPEFTVDEVLNRYPLHPAARIHVKRLAVQRMLDDPEQDAEAAVGAALSVLTRQCSGCGLLFESRQTVMADCDLCGRAVCPACAKLVPLSDGFAVLCPSCMLGLPRDLGALVSLRKSVLASVQDRRSASHGR